MAIYPIIFEGIRDGSTYTVSAATKTALAGKPSDIVGKVVTLTGNFEVGYGSSGDNPIGFVEQVEKYSTNDDTLTVSVVWNQGREGIPCAGSETAGSYLACDGTGGLTLSGTSAAPKASNAIAHAVDATGKTCAVYIRG